MTVPAPSTSATTGAGKSGKLAAWVRTHKPEAAGLGAGAAVVAFLILRKRSGSTSSGSTSSGSTSSAGSAPLAGATTLPSYPPGMGSAEYGALTNQLNGLGDALQQRLSSSGSSPASSASSTTATLAGVGETNIPANVHLAAPIVAAVPGPAGGDLFLGSDGGVFATGGAKFYGSYPGLPPSSRTGPPRKFTSIYSTRGGGYTEVDTQGQLYHFGPPVGPPPGTAA